MTKEELKAAFPEQYAAAVAAGNLEGFADGVAQERNRFKQALAQAQAEGFSLEQAMSIAATNGPKEAEAAIKASMAEQFAKAGFQVSW